MQQTQDLTRYVHRLREMGAIVQNDPKADLILVTCPAGTDDPERQVITLLLLEMQKTWPGTEIVLSRR